VKVPPRFESQQSVLELARGIKLLHLSLCVSHAVVVETPFCSFSSTAAITCKTYGNGNNFSVEPVMKAILS